MFLPFHPERSLVITITVVITLNMSHNFGLIERCPFFIEIEYDTWKGGRTGSNVG